MEADSKINANLEKNYSIIGPQKRNPWFERLVG